MKHLHSKEYKSIVIQDKDRDDGASDESDAENKDRISSTSKEDLQLTMQQSLERTKLWDINDAKSKEISTKICEMIALDAEPFNIVERNGFIRLMNHLCPRYKIPSRKYFSDTMMPNIYENIKEKVKDKLKDSAYISFTTDIWTSSVNNESFISLTAHFISLKNIEQEIHAISVKHFSQGHTGCNIADILNNILQEWNIEKEKVHVIVRDNAANMTLALNLTPGTGISCFIHTLQLVIRDALFLQRNIADVIAISRRIVTHFSHSSHACSKLKAIQEQLNIPNHKLIQDVTTRWNSTYYMLSRLYEQRQAISTYAVDNEISTLTSTHWSLIGNIVYVLKPFEEMTKLTSADKECISYVIPAVTILLTYLSKRNQENSGVVMLKQELKKSIEKRFLNKDGKGLDIQNNKFYAIATILDPRFKTRFTKNEMEIKDLIIEELLSIAHTPEEEKKKKSHIDKPSNSLPSFSLDDIHNDIWKCFDEIINSSKSDTESPNATNASITEEIADGQVKFQRKLSDRSKKKRQIYQTELEKYLVLPLTKRTDNPISWWKKHHSEFPNLKNLVLKYLSAPPSSVNSERLVSSAVNIYTDNRNNYIQTMFGYCQ
nr:PREDICTED: zinc finger BED domain-containing protein 4-like [Linepithema humile]